MAARRAEQLKIGLRRIHTANADVRGLQDALQEFVSTLATVLLGQMKDNAFPIACPIEQAQSLFRAGTAPVLPPNWIECNGQRIVDSDSPLHGSTAPNIAGFIMRVK